MQWYEILIIIAACAFVVGVCVWQIIRKAKGKGGCDCGGCSGCSGCSSCSSCASRKQQDKKDG